MSVMCIFYNRVEFRRKPWSTPGAQTCQLKVGDAKSALTVKVPTAVVNCPQRGMNAVVFGESFCQYGAEDCAVQQARAHHAVI